MTIDDSARPRFLPLMTTRRLEVDYLLDTPTVPVALTVEDLTWRGAECNLTPEQDVSVYEHSRELEDAIVEELQARKAAAWGGAL